MTIKDWPRGEQPREKLLHKGSDALSDAELIALFVGTGIKGKSAVDIARHALQNFGGLRALLNATHDQVCQIPGLGTTKHILLQGALELGRRYLHETLLRTDPLLNTLATRQYLTAKLRDLTYEVFSCLFMDANHRVIAYEELFQGSIGSANVYPREVVKRALHHNAAAVIFAHNHPSGIAKPSKADKVITQQLKQALALIETRVLDHLIVGDGQITSFAELGMLE